MTIEEIFDKAGGSLKIAEKTEDKQYTCEKWLERGIPEKHWSKLLKAFKWLDVETLFNANKEIRERLSK